MKTNDLLNPLVRVLPSLPSARTLRRATPASVLGLVRRRRRQPSLAWFAAGAMVAAAAAVLLAPTRRHSLRALLQRTGSGVGEQLGKLVGGRVGAHPLETAKLVQGTRDLVSSGAR